MTRRLWICSVAACLAALGLAAPAGAATPSNCEPSAPEALFGACVFEVGFEDAAGEPATQAGSHPFAMNTHLVFKHSFDPVKVTYDTAEDLKDFFGAQVAGLAGDQTAYPRCQTADFLTNPELHESLLSETACDEDADTVGAVLSGVSEKLVYSPLLNLEPPPGVAARLGWNAAGIHVILDIGVKAGGQYNLIAKQLNLPEVFPVIGAKVQIWGVPADPAHDYIRGRCLAAFGTNATGTVPDIAFQHSVQSERTSCPSPLGGSPPPLLTLPSSCTGPAPSSYAVDSWQSPGALLSSWEADLSDPRWDSGAALAEGFRGCERMPFAPSISAAPTARAAQSPTGLDFSLDVSDPGLTGAGTSDPEQVYQTVAASDIRKAVVTLPEGMTVNPSQAEGLEVCSEAALARETLRSAPGEGCPQASKIGTVEVQSPLISEALQGSLFVATPYENLAEDSLIALYMVFRNPQLGIIVKQALKVEPDPRTGQLVSSTVGDVPQLPFSHFRLHFREGARSPLISPPGCGGYDVEATLTPWSGGPPFTTHSSFQIVSGPDEGPCPQGAAPFKPGFQAGTLNNQAGSYSPFYMRLTRKDGEQDMSRFSFTLPAGVVPKLAGIPYCPEDAIAQAASRQGPHGGTEERDSPSCPAASAIGSTIAGAGVGSQLTYVPGRLYLAGPYHGDPISAVSITPAVAGPFDAGVVVVREALRLNPVTHVGEVDGAASDPIPHILKGIPLSVRELQVHADRPEFTLNATTCREEQAASRIWGAGTALDPLGETPADLSDRYQAAGCRALGFKPRLGLKLRGGTRRGKFPKLRAVYAPRKKGDANLRRLALAFPRSEFIEQGHFRTICTRVQFAAAGGHGEACPRASVYGHVRVWTPLLAEPLKGPVYLRSSSHNLPDAVFALHGLVDLEVAVRIDSAHGRLRATVQNAPDAPVSHAIVDMQGGQKGLFVNSTDICRGKRRARANMKGQNGRTLLARPQVRALSCRKGKRRRHTAHRRR